MRDDGLLPQTLRSYLYLSSPSSSELLIVVLLLLPACAIRKKSAGSSCLLLDGLSFHGSVFLLVDQNRGMFSVFFFAVAVYIRFWTFERCLHTSFSAPTCSLARRLHN